MQYKFKRIDLNSKTIADIKVIYYLRLILI